MRKAYDGVPVMQITKNLLRGGYAAEMGRKAVTRVRERVLASDFRDPMPWLRENTTDLSSYCRSIHAEAWREAERESANIEQMGISKLRSLDIDLGGGGNFPLLYFLVRHLHPEAVVETGVAAGFSSQAILSALRLNGRGELYSSDLPYFRIEDPEKYVGYIVDEDLKSNWNLYLRGDRDNLPSILSRVGEVDLFHYDSDKSYSGREWAMNLMLPRMRKGGAVIMDDLNDNTYFENFVRSTGIDFRVFEFNGKHVGLFYVN